MLKVAESYSSKQATLLLLWFVRYGEHQQNCPRHLTDDELEVALRARGFLWDHVIASLRKDPHWTIAGLENLVTPNWKVEVSGGGKATVNYRILGVDLPLLEFGPGVGSLRLEYAAQFFAACQARDRAIADCSIDDTLTMVSKGFSSVEAGLAIVGHLHKANFPNEKRLDDRLPLMTRIETWLPHIGIDLDKSSSMWCNIDYLRGVRDNAATHPKFGAAPRSNKDLAVIINKFRSLAELIFLISIALLGQATREQIRAAAYPDVFSLE
ncbi:hypothetical protein F4693_000147 [Sphingomonas endophytica]|uniref:Uncharacterized protein n=1 Tax=Sphingomonas endophytica TaxID=869719 RepID=A0A7X0J901_9SPHN|nr:hypothetical protein [Sphingomonas endophytica]MBB6503198.1 hypothetical protein [Sphingomonas endophytica]